MGGPSETLKENLVFSINYCLKVNFKFKSQFGLDKILVLEKTRNNFIKGEFPVILLINLNHRLPVVLRNYKYLH